MIEPSLQLHFAKTRQLDRRITFARADTADNQASYYDRDGLVKFVRKGEPRFTHDPATGSSLGLLIEEARTNLLTYSEQFDNAAWTKAGLLAFGSGSVANATTAPDGTATADKIIESTANDEHRAERTRSVVAGEKYTWSIFLKAETRTSAYLGLRGGVWTGGGNAIIRINLATFSVVYSGGTATDHPAVVVPGRDGWVRVSFSGTVATNGTAIFRAGTSDGTNYSYTGDGTSGIYIWGAQLEAGAFPTSYIPTAASDVTRAADSAVMTGANFSSWYRQDEGAFVAVGRTNRTNDGLGFLIWAQKTGTVGRGTTLSFDTASQLVRGYVRNDSTTGAQSISNIADGIQVASALTYNASTSYLAANGTVSAGVSTSPYPGIDALQIGYGEISAGSPGYLNGAIERITFFPAALTSAEIKALSSL